MPCDPWHVYSVDRHQRGRITLRNPHGVDGSGNVDANVDAGYVTLTADQFFVYFSSASAPDVTGARAPRQHVSLHRRRRWSRIMLRRRGAGVLSGGSVAASSWMKRRLMAASLLLAAVGVALVARSGVAVDANSPADSTAERDLLEVQGRWEREEPAGSGAAYRRVVKEVKGNEESVAYYREDGSVWRAHRAQFKLSRTGDVKVFTFSNVQITDGDGKGSRFQGPASYIYVATDRQFKEVSGFLPGQEAQPIAALVWKRAQEDPAHVVSLPTPDERLQGDWEPFHSEEGGADRKERGDFLVKFEGKRFTVLREGKLMLGGTFTTYAAREPRRIDVLIEQDADNPSNAGKTLLGIYAIEGDELRWCTGTTAASQAPTDFTTREGEPNMLVVMRRVKPKAG